MDNMYYECTIRYDQTQETGLVKKVSEKYLVEACCFTEAETRITEDMRRYVSGELDITAIKRVHILGTLRGKMRQRHIRIF